MYLSEYILDLQIPAYNLLRIFLIAATFCGLSTIVVKVSEYVHEILGISKILANSLTSSRKIEPRGILDFLLPDLLRTAFATVDCFFLY